MITEHAPAAHEAPFGATSYSAPHVWLHAPQFGNVVRSVVQGASEPHVPQPASQAPVPHVPLTHDAAPCAGFGQWTLQSPQLFGSPFVQISQPSVFLLARSPSQSL